MALRQGNQPAPVAAPRYALDVAASGTDCLPWLRARLVLHWWRAKSEWQERCYSLRYKKKNLSSVNDVLK